MLLVSFTSERISDNIQSIVPVFETGLDPFPAQLGPDLVLNPVSPVFCGLIPVGTGVGGVPNPSLRDALD